MKLRHFFAAMAFAVIAMPLSAQVKAKWGNTDTRYPVEAGAKIKTTGVNSTAAWRGERVNFQLLVSNAGEDAQVTYSFSDLKCGKNVIPASNVVGGFVQPVITDRFTGCGRHAVDAYGENLSADRITCEDTTLLAANTSRGLWLTVEVPQAVKPGTYTGSVTVTANGKTLKNSYSVKVLNRTLPAPKEWRFHLDFLRRHVLKALVRHKHCEFFYDIPKLFRVRLFIANNREFMPNQRMI